MSGFLSELKQKALHRHALHEVSLYLEFRFTFATALNLPFVRYFGQRSKP
jgi:hypothetical protein